MRYCVYPDFMLLSFERSPNYHRRPACSFQQVLDNVGRCVDHFDPVDFQQLIAEMKSGSLGSTLAPHGFHDDRVTAADHQAELFTVGTHELDDYATNFEILLVADWRGTFSSGSD